MTMSIKAFRRMLICNWTRRKLVKYLGLHNGHVNEAVRTRITTEAFIQYAFKLYLYYRARLDVPRSKSSTCCIV